MLHPSTFRDLVSGRRRGIRATSARLGFRLVEVPYTMAVRWRNWRFDVGMKPIERVPVPVVSVGNLTLGGTGKSPMVRWIAEWFRRRGIPVALISRGYGAKRGGINDEALELAQRLPGVPHIQNPDRVEAARTAIRQFDCRAIVLDDAFQHRRIHRDLDLVMLDALEPFGFGHVFPRGTLREPVDGLGRADVVVLARADMLEPSERPRIRDEVRRHAPESTWAEVRHAPRTLLSADGNEESLESLRGQRVAAFCGVGNPAGFRHTLQTCGYRLADFREFADHHRYDQTDIQSLGQWADRLDVAAVLATHKDMVKLHVDRLGGCPLRAVTIGLEFLAGEAELEATLLSVRANT